MSPVELVCQGENSAAFIAADHLGPGVFVGWIAVEVDRRHRAKSRFGSLTGAKSSCLGDSRACIHKCKSKPSRICFEFGPPNVNGFRWAPGRNLCASGLRFRWFRWLRWLRWLGHGLQRSFGRALSFICDPRVRASSCKHQDEQHNDTDTQYLWHDFGRIAIHGLWFLVKVLSHGGFRTGPRRTVRNPLHPCFGPDHSIPSYISSRKAVGQNQQE